MSNLEIPVLSIIIPTKDRIEIFSVSLSKAVEAIKNMNAEIIVINDSEQALGTEYEISEKVRIFNNNGKGVATARNFGAKKAKAELLLFLDNDMWLNQENIDSYLKLSSKLGDVVINLNWEYPDYLKLKLEKTALGRYLVGKDFTTMKGWNKGNNWRDSELFESSGIAGANMLIRKSTYNLLNGFNESFPFAGFEDFDFSRRVRKMGIKTYIFPNSMMFHNEANKLELIGWLHKNYSSAVTKKHAINIGYTELVQKRSIIKRVIYFCLMPLSGLLIVLTNLFSHFIIFDSIYRILVNMLTGLYIYKGYNGYSL